MELMIPMCREPYVDKIGLGTLMGLLAFIRYKKIERQIDKDTYKPSLILDILLTISVLAVGVFLVMYLIHST